MSSTPDSAAAVDSDLEGEMPAAPFQGAPVLAIVGPTAAGKSELAMELARRFDGEIVNGDAFQVYRGLDIGTAKPSPAMRAEIPHHLVDVLDPEEPCSAGEFARRARRAIREIGERNRTALVVGGSGLYLRALFEGLSPLPRSRPEIRQGLEARVEAGELDQLYLELRQCDPETASRLAPRDRQRIVRALEVFALSGEPLSAWIRRAPAEPPISPLRIGLTLPRSILYDRIAVRVNHMVERGWVAEVEDLLRRGIPPSAPAFKAIGYRQMVQHIRGECGLHEAIEDTVRATRRYAKRQVTWFRKEAEIRWLSVLDIDAELPALLHEIQIRGAFAR